MYFLFRSWESKCSVSDPVFYLARAEMDNRMATCALVAQHADGFSHFWRKNVTEPRKGRFDPAGQIYGTVAGSIRV